MLWWRRAAAQGLVEALEELAALHFNSSDARFRNWPRGAALLCEAVKRSHQRRAPSIFGSLRMRLELKVDNPEDEEGRSMELLHYGRLLSRGLPVAYAGVDPLGLDLITPPVQLYTQCKERVVQVCCVLLGLRKKKQSVFGMLPRDIANLLCRMLLQTIATPMVWGGNTQQADGTGGEKRYRRSARLEAKKNRH